MGPRLTGQHGSSGKCATAGQRQKFGGSEREGKAVCVVWRWSSVGTLKVETMTGKERQLVDGEKEGRNIVCARDKM